MFEPPGALRLRHLSGPQRGTVVVLRPPRSRLGRSRTNDIIFADREGAASSGTHAEAVRTSGQWFIHDLQSTHGTRLNGEAITRAPFGPGDRLQFGDIECEVLPGRFVPIVAAVAFATTIVIAAVYALWLRPANSFETIASDIARSVYMVAIDDGDARQLIGTAFVVGDDLLATNAHVAQALNGAKSDSRRRTLVVRSDSEQTHLVTAVHISKRWNTASIADDVALLRVAGLADDAVPLVLADDQTLTSLGRGATIATFGFPAMSTDVRRPRGRVSIDVLGDVRDGRYLAVGLRIAPGTSGSPIFLPNGTVVGVVAGGDFAVSPAGDKSPTGTNVNWGISTAPLQQLLRECAEQRAQ